MLYFIMFTIYYVWIHSNFFFYSVASCSVVVLHCFFCLFYSVASSFVALLLFLLFYSADFSWLFTQRLLFTALLFVLLMFWIIAYYFSFLSLSLPLSLSLSNSLSLWFSMMLVCCFGGGFSGLFVFSSQPFSVRLTILLSFSVWHGRVGICWSYRALLFPALPYWNI